MVFYNGTGGGVYPPGATGEAGIPVGPANAAGFAVISPPVQGMQNGAPDGLALVDPANVVVQFLSYEGSFSATDGVAIGLTSTDVGVLEVGTEPAGQSLQLIDGIWTGPIAETFGAANEEPPLEPGDCDETPTHTIGQVQGNTDVTPLGGQAVIVRGTVVSDLQEGGYGGYFVQDAGDEDAATSDGVFVFAPLPAVALGDVVQVSGTPGESFGQTQIADTTEVGICSTGATPPPAASLDLPATTADLEPLEGMLATPVDTLTVSEVFNLNRFGEVVLSQGGRLVIPTETAEPGTAAQAVMASNAARRLVLDDGLSTNLVTAGVAPPYLTLDDPVRVGDQLGTLQPSVLSFGFSAWRLQPADGSADGNTFVEKNPRTAAPRSVGGDIQVGAFNVLNFFFNWDHPDARGATTEAEMLQQRAKIVTAITDMDAEVLALQEIENSSVISPETPYSAHENLVGALNEAEGEDVWEYVEASETSDVITNAIIYRTDAVTPVGEPRQITEDAVWDNAREPIAQTFTARGDTFTVIGNHLKSKGSGTGPGNVDIGDGQGASNADRVAQAGSLMAFVDEVETAVGDPDVLLLGDFNAYLKEDPIDVIHGAGFVDLGATMNPRDYSYVFNGESGSLDHAFASPSQRLKVTGVDTWNINGVESIAYQYDGHDSLYSEYAYAASDHSPEILGLALRSPEQMCDGKPATRIGTGGNDVLAGTPAADVIVGLGGHDTIHGLAGNDTVCAGDGNDTVRGGAGNDRISGGNGNDRLYGEAGNDFLDGGAGNNIIVQ